MVNSGVICDSRKKNLFTLLLAEAFPRPKTRARQMLADVAPQEFARPRATEIGDRPVEERTHVIDSQAIQTAYCIFAEFSHQDSTSTELSMPSCPGGSNRSGRTTR